MIEIRRFFVVFLASGIALTADATSFEKVTPESQGISSDGLRAMSQWIRGEGLDVRSLIVLRNGKMVLEWYAGGVTAEMNHNVFSVTKSVVSAISGIAVAERRLPGLEEPIGKTLDLPPLIGEITLEELLTMRSGLPQSRASKPTGAERELFDRIAAAPDRLDEISTLVNVNPPGNTFAYSNIEPQLVSAMIEKVYGLGIVDVAQEKFFKPLDFRGVRWSYPDKMGLYPGGYGLRLRPIDMAKLGQLYLQGGQWNGVRILPTAWIHDSVTSHSVEKYGFYWWTGIVGGRSFAAKGVRGQQVLVVPEKKIVFVVTADLPPEQVKSILGKLNRDHLLKAIISNVPLEDNPEANEALREELSKAIRYIPDHRKSLPDTRLPQIPLN